jgi:carbonic anhydrase/acetyltransferase-like protein (isoleucine patch superfamily)
MAIRSFGERRPILGEEVFIDDSAQVIGSVDVKDGASIWPGAVVRADDDSVEIGRGSAVMDLAFVEGPKGRPTRVGTGCIISHGARLHGCEIGDESVVGIGAIVLDGAVIGPRSIVAAGALIPPGTRIPPESFVVGMPGKVSRSTTSADVDKLHRDLKALAVKAKAYRGQAALCSS